MKAFGRVRIPKQVRLALNPRSAAELEARRDLGMVVTTDAFLAWIAWGNLVGSLWARRRVCHPGSMFESGMNAVRREAQGMRAALCAQDWQRALLHGVSADKAILLMDTQVHASIANGHPKKQALQRRGMFQRKLRLECFRFSRRYGRPMTHDDARQWAGLNGLLPADLSERAATEWISEVLGRPKRGRPYGKK